MSSQSQSQSSSVQGRPRDGIATVSYPHRSTMKGSKEETISRSTVSSHSQSCSLQGDPPPRQSTMFDIGRIQVRCTMLVLFVDREFHMNFYFLVGSNGKSV